MCYKASLIASKMLFYFIGEKIIFPKNWQSDN